jgi:type II secretory pathway pseudopilin PulG
MQKPKHILQAGYTLIELLLYVVLVSILLLSITYFFGMTADSRIKTQTIAEVNDQGTAIADAITEAIHNASSITTPAAGVISPSLTLATPTSSTNPTVFDLSTTVLGYNQDGTATDSGDSNSLEATKFTATATGTISTLYIMIGPTVAASPNNLGQMGIYSGTSSPSALLANSASVALKANSWNAFPVSPVTVTSGQTYWLAFNTNGLVAADNAYRYHTGAAGQTMFTNNTFGTWPNSWTGSTQANENAVYAPISVSGSPSTIRIKEGAGAVVNLNSNDIEVTALSFRNLTRTGTKGIIQYSFTLNRINPANRNEYDYQKTFNGSASVLW